MPCFHYLLQTPLCVLFLALANQSETTWACLPRHLHTRNDPLFWFCDWRFETKALKLFAQSTRQKHQILGHGLSANAPEGSLLRTSPFDLSGGYSQRDSMSLSLARLNMMNKFAVGNTIDQHLIGTDDRFGDRLSTIYTIPNLSIHYSTPFPHPDKYRHLQKKPPIAPRSVK